MAREPSLHIVMNGDKFEIEAVDPVAAKRAELLAQAEEAEIAAGIDEASAQYASLEDRRLSITEHLMVLGLRKASKDELRRIILDAIAAEAAA